QDLVAGGNVAALQVVDRNLVTLAYSAVPGIEAGDALSAADTASIDRAIDSGDTSSRLEGDVLTVIAPIVNPTTGSRVGAAIVDLSTRRIFDTLRRNLEAAAALAVTVLCLGVAASTILARRVTQPVAQLTAAAAAIEAGASVPATLADITRRRDELGQLA